MTALYWLLTAANVVVSFIGGRTIARWAINHARTRQEPADPVVGHWPCPDCGVTVPITATTQRVAVVRLDPTDIEAHKLTHQEQQ